MFLFWASLPRAINISESWEEYILQLHLVQAEWSVSKLNTIFQLRTTTLFTLIPLLWWKKSALTPHHWEEHRPASPAVQGPWLSTRAQTIEASAWTYCAQWRPFVAHGEKQIEALHVFPPPPPPLHGRLSIHQGAVEQMPCGRAWQPCLEQLHLSLKGIRHWGRDIRQDKLWSKRWKIWGRACCLSWGLW